MTVFSAQRPTQSLACESKWDSLDFVETSYDKDGLYLGRLADVFGDPTRRGIYRHLRSCEAPQSASEVAEVFGLHRTVARAHLEKLSEMDLVRSSTRRRPGGGRPAKIYSVTDARLEIMLPPRRYERLARLLLRLVTETVPPEVAAASAASLGRAFGEETAREFAGNGDDGPARLSPGAVMDWMDLSGYGAALSSGGNGETIIEIHNCVYRELSQEYPDVVCAFDRSTLCGMLAVDAEAHTQTHALSSGDAYCRHEFRL
jgi:predicted ArsR family transcriptional regulator